MTRFPCCGCERIVQALPKCLQSLKILLVLILIVVGSAAPAHADKAKSAYKAGLKAESQNKFDAAYEAYRQAAALNPRNSQYMTAYLRVRASAAMAHMTAGQKFLDGGKSAQALVEFQQAAEIDPTSPIAQQQAQHISESMNKEGQQDGFPGLVHQSPLSQSADDVTGPIELGPMSNAPITLRMTSPADQVYKVVAKMAGINVLFDPDYRPQRVNIELNEVTARQALQMLGLQTKTFWEPISSNTIFVTTDNAGKRREVEGNVVQAFYLHNVSTPADLQDAANTIKALLDVTRIQLVPTQKAMILRGTHDQMVMAEKLLKDIDKPKPEVVIDISVLEVSRDRARTLGITPPTSATMTLQPPATGIVTPGGGTTTSGGGNQMTLNSFGKLTPDNFLVSIPGATLSFLMSDSNTKVLQNPQLRAIDNQKSTLKIGDRIPIATGSFSSTAGGVSPLVNTQFQYIDVGVNVDIVPHVHSEHEVTLQMSLEISNVSGLQNIGGISQPVIGQRRIEHETRLQDGEACIVGGIMEDTESQATSGYPWLSKIPLVKYLVSQESRQKNEKEIVFVIKAHIVRAQEVTEQNVRMVDVGAGTSVQLNHEDPVDKVPKPQTSASGAPRPQAAPANQR